ncbi:MAG: imelysin family protein [Arenicellales bacterium]
MKLKKPSLVSLITVPFLLFFSAQPLHAEKWNLKVADELLIPAYKDLSRSATELSAKTLRFCGAPSDDGMIHVKTAYKQAFLNWEKIQYIRFGPIQTLMRDFRIQMWPDKKGKVGKHLNKLLADDDYKAKLAPDKFALGSVAVQGLSAFERLIYGYKLAGDVPQNKRQCDVMQSIANNIEAISTGLLDEWVGEDDPYRQYLIPPPEGNLYFESDQEISSKLLNSFYTELLVIGTQKLSLPLGEGKAGQKKTKPNPKRAEAWRSQLSLAAIQTNVESLFSLYKIGFEPRVKEDSLNEAMYQAFESLLGMIKQTDQSIFSKVKDASASEHLLEMRMKVTGLRGLVSNRLSKALNIPLAFNGLDGD